MIDASEVREEDENFKNAVDYMLEALEEKDPGHFAVKQYKKYKLAAGVVTCRRTLNKNSPKNGIGHSKKVDFLQIA